MRKQENWGKLSEFPDFADAYGQDAAEFLGETFIEWYDAKHRGPTPAYDYIWNGTRNRYEKVARFMELAMRERVLLGYRDRMKRLLIRKCGGI